MGRPLWQINAELAALKAERKAARRTTFKPGHVRSRSFRPEGPGQRQPRITDPGFLAFLRRQPCRAAHLGGCDGPIEAAHIRYSDAAKGAVNPGMQRKNHDRHANPLCRFHHQHDQHRKNERNWWAMEVGVDAYDSAAGYFAQYLCPAPSPKEA
ncbi:MAG: hypothetical protein ACRED4_00685 [Brevundimonas sp.]